MGFEIVENPGRTLWAPVNYGSGGASTVYQGGIVYTGGSQGLIPIGTASGAVDTSQKHVPFGVVLGVNDRTPTYGTYGQQAAAVQSQAAQAARDFAGAEGVWAKNDQRVMALVQEITPQSVLKGQIFNSTFGTVPGVVSVSTGSATGAGFTASANDFTPVAYNATYFGRSGANAGLMRTGYDTSATVHTVYEYFQYDIAVGDTFVAVNLPEVGKGLCQFNSVGTFIDNSAALTSDYYVINVLDMDLRVAGFETVKFRFNLDHFCHARA